ncbi:hypothetical protein GCM10010401_00260 [Rarobacter faecitabidus]|uniref:3-methyladenine DNA glycosylase n=1 Tax=Rarobacter faecitabidus TaxID=13243 RepID=A0A542ZWV0_RARFA|nr:3-methyladenine DNA glycosylase [Rarobacter faecitabidus]TQL64833.1 hypothetical protein FB461_1356 [Rarobacter faecitabidus]
MTHSPPSAAVQSEAVLLDAPTWRAAAADHAKRADSLTAARRARTAAGTKDEVEDFLFTYYPVRPGQLRRWHPGVGIALVVDSEDEASEWVAGRWYGAQRRSEDPSASLREDAECADRQPIAMAVGLDTRAFLADRIDAVRWIHAVLTSTAGRRPAFGCFGFHEWAMVYRQDAHRHSLPLRLGQEATDALVEGSSIQCSHFDAFRFFTPAARPLNALQPTPESRVTMDQPGCLHANMDLLRHATKLGPAVPGDLLLDCFELARDVRVLDMEASPYDVTSRGYGVVPIESARGRAEYARRQREVFVRAEVLRARLSQVTSALLALAD